MNQEISTLLNQLSTEKEKMLNQLSGWTEDMLKANPDGGWNALQVVEHVIGSEVGTLQYMKKKTLAPASELGVVGEENASAAGQLSAALQSDGKWKAPDVLPDPVGNRSLAEYAAFWQSLRADYEGFIQQLSDEYHDKLIFRHPRAGMFDLAQTLRFLTDHITHHLFQLERIRTAIGS